MSAKLTDEKVGLMYREACNEPTYIKTLNEYELNKLFQLNFRIIEKQNALYVETCLLNEHKDSWAVNSKRVHKGLLGEPLALKKRILHQLQMFHADNTVTKEKKGLESLIKNLTNSHTIQIREDYKGKKPASIVPLLFAMKELRIIEEMEFDNFKALCESVNIWLGEKYSYSGYNIQHTYYCNKVDSKHLAKLEAAKKYLEKMI